MSSPAPPGGRPRAIAALLLWPVFCMLIFFGLLMVLVGVQGLHQAHRPVGCGGEAMPDDGRFTCFTGYGPARATTSCGRGGSGGSGRRTCWRLGPSACPACGAPRATRHLGRVQRAVREG
ncbi:hypothetical protein [Actinomadura kijaniata]|uniref:hypothetical protein n=1 Tax=Actinomadura kijaniata TaxID=46161 RepID=UPI00160150FF|nr:hypothetical protein [Actinomadura namibiensis]